MEHILALLTDPTAWISLFTLAILEIVLGIDNIIVISMVTTRLPLPQQPKAQFIGLALAMVIRLILLFFIAWLNRLIEPVITVAGSGFSWRDIILFAGGLFLIYKAVQEINEMMEEAKAPEISRKKTNFMAAIIQITLLDIVFSIDSIITAVGIATEIPVMGGAVIIAIGIMMFATTPVSNFIHRHPSIKMLALAFLILVGIMLMADSLHQHIERGYLYAAMGFAGGVEVLNFMVRDRQQKALQGQHDMLPDGQE